MVPLKEWRTPTFTVSSAAETAEIPEARPTAMAASLLYFVIMLV